MKMKYIFIIIMSFFSSWQLSFYQVITSLRYQVKNKIETLFCSVLELFLIFLVNEAVSSDLQSRV